MRKCSVDGCEDKHVGKGFCNRHLKQHRKWGEIRIGSYNYKKDKNDIIDCGEYSKIILRNIKGEVVGEALVDVHEIERIAQYKWHKLSTGHAGRRFDENSYELMHWAVVGKHDGFSVDHINGNKLDNRMSNLRIGTQQQNSYNRAVSKRNASGFRGVSFDKRRQKWESYITSNGKREFLGYFDVLNDAIDARISGEIKFHGEYSTHLSRSDSAKINESTILH